MALARENEFSGSFFGHHPEPAARCRELATWIADGYRALRGGDHQRKVELNDRGMFPSTLAP